MHNMPERLHYFAIQYSILGTIHRALVAMGEAGDQVYWGGSPSHTTKDALDDFKIIKDYGWDIEWPDDFDIDQQYASDFPPIPCDLETAKNKATEGVLAPDGTFYDCEYGGHSMLCLDLLRVMGIDEGKNAEDTLLDLGWLSLRHASIGSNYDNPPTDAQKQWLKRAAELNPDETYQEKVSRYLRHWEMMNTPLVLKEPATLRRRNQNAKI